MVHCNLRKGIAFGLIVLFIGAGIIPSTVGLKKEKTQIQTIGSRGYIQDLIDNASEGDTVFIPSGIYYENIDIGKSINLVGEDKNITIINGEVWIESDWVNISGFTIRNGEYGILPFGNYITIKNNIIYNTETGIYLDGIITILNNYISNSSLGIELYDSCHCIIQGNKINAYIHSIDLLYNAHWNIIENNYFYNCNGVKLSGRHNRYPRYNKINNNSFFNTGLVINSGYLENTFLDNTVNGKSLVFLINESDKILNVDAGQIFLIKCSNITVQNQNLCNTTIAIDLVGSNGCIVVNNNIYSNTETGKDMGGENHIISNNYISNNNWGIECFGNNNSIKNNIISNCERGLFFHHSQNNTIECNNISNNNIGLFSVDNYDFNTIKSNQILNNEKGMILHNSYFTKISNNIILNNWFTGIEIYDSYNNEFINNVLLNDGITLENSNNNKFENNTVNGKPLIVLENKSDMVIENAGQVFLINCENITLKVLNISNTTIGICLYKTKNCHFLENVIKNNRLGGMYLYESDYNTFYGNNLSRNNCSIFDGIIVFDYCNYNIINSNIIMDNNKGVLLSNCKNNTLIDNYIFSNQMGICLLASINNTIKRNQISDCLDFGIELIFECDYNHIIENNISNNGENGIRLLDGCNRNNLLKNNVSLHNYSISIEGYSSDFCEYNKIMDNNIFNNNYGVKILKPTRGNIICHNNFINNVNNAFDNWNDNIWHGGSFGNYWSDYEERYPNATKLKWKGIWDTPYDIDGWDNKDPYPLIKQWPDSRTRSRSITTPNNQTTIFPILHWLIEHFPLLERLLGLLL